jgi:hypothetical protein
VCLLTWTPTRVGLPSPPVLTSEKGVESPSPADRFPLALCDLIFEHRLEELQAQVGGREQS